MNDEFLAKLTSKVQNDNRKIIQEANLNQTDIIRCYIEKEISELKNKFTEEITRKYAALEEKYKELKSRYEKLEKGVRKNNLIIFGLESQHEDLPKFVAESLSKCLKVSVEKTDIYIYMFFK